MQLFFPLVSGIGLGMLFHAPYQIFTRTLKAEEIATGTSAFFLVRFTGATVGLVRYSDAFLRATSHALAGGGGGMSWIVAACLFSTRVTSGFPMVVA